MRKANEQRSEVARLLSQIRAEYEAAQRGLVGLSYGVSQHEFIAAKMENMGRIHVQLQSIVGDAAIAMIAEQLNTPDSKEKRKGEVHMYPHPEADLDAIIVTASQFTNRLTYEELLSFSNSLLLPNVDLTWMPWYFKVASLYERNKQQPALFIQAIQRIAASATEAKQDAKAAKAMSPRVSEEQLKALLNRLGYTYEEEANEDELPYVRVYAVRGKRRLLIGIKQLLLIHDLQALEQRITVIVDKTFISRTVTFSGSIEYLVEAYLQQDRGILYLDPRYPPGRRINLYALFVFHQNGEKDTYLLEPSDLEQPQRRYHWHFGHCGPDVSSDTLRQLQQNYGIDRRTGEQL